MVSDTYVDDSRKPLPAAERAKRERVLDALETDMRDRGGLDRGPAWWGLEEDEREHRSKWCRDDDHARGQAESFAAGAEQMLRGNDGKLVADALRMGTHVFLTEDRGILRKSRLLFGWGLSVLRPGELLDALDDAGEFGDGGVGFGSPGFELAPDLLSLSRFYAIADLD